MRVRRVSPPRKPRQPPSTALAAPPAAVAHDAASVRREAAPRQPSVRVVTFAAEPSTGGDGRAGAGEPTVGVSRQIDPFHDFYGAFGLVTPPYGEASYDVITRRYDASDVLQSAIDAMVTNICAFGVQLVGYRSDLPPESNDEIAKERARIQVALDSMSSLGGFNAVRKRVRRDLDLFGDGYYEVLRDGDGRLVGLEHIPAGTVRKSRLSQKPVPMNVWTRNAAGEFVRRVAWRRVRRYAQAVDGQYQWFKEFGDPRPIRGDNGEEDAAAPPQDLANEIINLCHYEPDGYNLTPYGKPRWRGAGADVAGRAAASIVNHDVFDNKAIPPMAILVEGAQFDDDVIERIKEHVRSVRGRASFHAPLILEARAADAPADASDPAGMTRPGAVPRIHFEDLSKSVPDDAQYLKYREDCVASVRMAFRVPGIYLGRSDDYNLATAQTARVVTEEQVFAPERAEEDDLYNITLAPELGARWTKFQTKGPPLLDENTLLKVIEVGSKSGALTVENVATLLEPILRLELSSAAAWRQLPVAVLQALASKALIPSEIAETIQITNLAAPSGGGPGGTVGTDGTGDELPDGPALGGAPVDGGTDGTGDTGDTGDTSAPDATTADG